MNNAAEMTVDVEDSRNNGTNGDSNCINYHGIPRVLIFGFLAEP